MGKAGLTFLCDRVVFLQKRKINCLAGRKILVSGLLHNHRRPHVEKHSAISRGELTHVARLPQSIRGSGHQRGRQSPTQLERSISTRIPVIDANRFLSITSKTTSATLPEGEQKKQRSNQASRESSLGESKLLRKHHRKPLGKKKLARCRLILALVFSAPAAGTMLSPAKSSSMAKAASP